MLVMDAVVCFACEWKQTTQKKTFHKTVWGKPWLFLKQCYFRNMLLGPNNPVNFSWDFPGCGQHQNYKRNKENCSAYSLLTTTVVRQTVPDLWHKYTAEIIRWSKENERYGFPLCFSVCFGWTSVILYHFLSNLICNIINITIWNFQSSATRSTIFCRNQVFAWFSKD